MVDVIFVIVVVIVVVVTAVFCCIFPPKYRTESSFAAMNNKQKFSRG